MLPDWLHTIGLWLGEETGERPIRGVQGVGLLLLQRAHTLQYKGFKTRP